MQVYTIYLQSRNISWSCPGVIFRGGNCPRWEFFGDNWPVSNSLGVIAQRTIMDEINCPVTKSNKVTIPKRTKTLALFISHYCGCLLKALSRYHQWTRWQQIIDTSFELIINYLIWESLISTISYRIIILSQSEFTCSNSTIETREQYVKSVQG